MAQVCPGEWVYHAFDVPTSGSHNFQFHIVKHTGDLDVVVRHHLIPLKLVPPYEHITEAMHEVDTQVCNSEYGERVWLGMLGAHHCATYEISVSILDESLPCVPCSSAIRHHYWLAPFAHECELETLSKSCMAMRDAPVELSQSLHAAPCVLWSTDALSLLTRASVLIAPLVRTC